MIIHPNSNLVGKKLHNIKNPSTSNSLYADLIQAHKTTKSLRYKWDKLDDKQNYIYNKISWIEYIPYLEWYIASSAYTDDFKDFYKPNKTSKLININEPIDKALNIIRTSLAVNDITLIEDYASEKKLNLFDSELMQVILNIFKNSVDNFKFKDTVKATIWIKTQDTNEC